MQKTRIEGRVAQVLNARQLVINRGEADGVRQGMKFEILSESLLQITDPETGQILDELNRVKVRVAATEVRERVTVCSTYEQRETGHTSVLDAFVPARTVPVTLRVEPTQAPQHLDPEESYVRRGDRAVQMIENGEPDLPFSWKN